MQGLAARPPPPPEAHPPPPSASGVSQHHHGSSPLKTKGAIRPENEEVMQKFSELTEQSRHYFAQLRDLPLYSAAPWAHYFHKAFQVYSSLWKFQQEHRVVLTQEGLERWDIGEIASKIGQLYFNYYLRTSELRFLIESYTFYDAIRRRQYFLNTPQTASYSLCHLRYYARFMIVCLLLGKLTEVWQFMNELQALIQTHSVKFQEVEAHEWSMVVQEILAFLEAETLIPTIKPTGPPPYLCSKRLARDQLATHKSCLSDVVILSYYHRQLKIAELPIDAFRILQTFEWEVQLPGAAVVDDANGPSELANQLAQSDVLEGPQAADVYQNPQKQMIYRAKVTRVLAQLAAAAEAARTDKFLVIYVAANAPAAPPARPNEARPRLELRANSLRAHGVLLLPPPLAHRRQPHGADAPESSSTQSQPGDLAAGAPSRTSSAAQALPSATDPDQVLLPEDLIHLTRKQLVMIVDSDNSSVFASLSKSALSYPPLLLLSPTSMPASIQPASQVGKLFTLFLSSPVHAVVTVCNIQNVDAAVLQGLHASVDAALHGFNALLNQPGVTSPWAVVCQDAFMRRVVLRFILCRAVLAEMEEFGDQDGFAPQAVPPLPSIVDARSLVVKDLAASVVRSATQ